MLSLWRAVRPYLILSVVAGVLLWPLLGSEVPCTNDGALYYHQVATLKYSVSRGLIFSRWMPDTALGYGIPYFNYREPLPRYIALVLVLLGIATPTALNLTWALGILLAGWGIYRLASDVFRHETVGLMAGIAAMSSPYLLVNVYRRGALVETIGLGLIPWVLWAFWRTIRDRHTPWPVTRAALLWAALGLSHNITTMLTLPIMGGYAVLLGWLAHRQMRTESALACQSRWRCLQPWLRPMAAYLGGLGLASFFLVPAFLERNLVHTWVRTSTRSNNYANQFASLAQAITLPVTHNPACLNPPLLTPLALVTILLALAGLIGGWLIFRREGDAIRQTHLVLFATLATADLSMALPISRPVWDAIPLLAFVQFPWRFLGQASLWLAILAGLGIGLSADWLAQRIVPWLRGIPPTAAGILLMILGLPWTYPVAWCPVEPHPTIIDVNDYELNHLIALSPLGADFPMSAVRPDDSPLLADYAAGREPRRFDEISLPQGSSAIIAYHPLGVEVQVETPQAFTARYLTFYFPGWQVKLDGQRIPIVVEPETGLITFEVPSGLHKIEVRFGTTSVRAVVTAISAMALVALLGSLFLAPGSERRVEPQLRQAPTPALWLAVASVGLVMLVARIVWPDGVPSLWQVARPPVLQHQAEVIFGGQMRLLGYDLDQELWPADREIQVDTYWTRMAEMNQITRVALFVLDEQGLIWNEKGIIRPLNYENPPVPTFAWPLNTFAIDSQLIRLLPGTPPGHYTLALTLYDRDTFQAFAAPRFPEGVTTQAPLGAVDVAWPRQPLEVSSLDIQYRTMAQIDGLTLLGYNLDRDEAWPGESALVTLFWLSGETLDDAPVLSLTIDGESVTEPFPLAHGSAIPAGASWREQVLLRIPASTEAGNHSIGFVMGGGTSFVLDTIGVRALERIHDPPTVGQPVDALFGGTIRLVGLDIEGKGSALLARLIWAAEADMPESYKVFIHALDVGGNIIAQSDAIPAESTRPTTGWLPGEYIIDLHTIAVPPDQVVALRIGLYDPATGIRLRLADGQDAIVVPVEALP